MNPWLERRVLLYAHQGGAKEAPSSTMFAFEQAIANGADALEMDVHATLDRVLVVTHDETVDRTTATSGLIAAMTWAELQQLDNAHWWAPGHDAVTGLHDHEYPLRGRAPIDRSLGIARLSDVLDAFPTTILNLDIKGTTPDLTPGITPYEELLAELLRSYQRFDDVIVASFFDGALTRFRDLGTGIATSTALNESFAIANHLRNATTPVIHASTVAMQIPYRFGPAGPPLFDAALVNRIHDIGLAVHVWTIDDPAEMEEVLQLGIDAIITDFPAVAQGVMTNMQLPRVRR